MLPLHPELASVLRIWRKHCPPTAEGLVLAVRGEGERAQLGIGEGQDMLGLPALLEAAAIRALPKPWHASRHTFALQAVMSGATPYEVQQLLGHATPAMTQRYAHLAPNHLASSIARLSFERPAKADIVDIAEVRAARMDTLWTHGGTP